MNAIAQNMPATPVWKSGAVGADSVVTGGGDAFAGMLGQLLGLTQGEGNDGAQQSIETLPAGFSPLLLLALLPQAESVDGEQAAKQLELLLEQHPELFAELLSAQGFAQWSAKVDELFAALTGEQAPVALGEQPMQAAAVANPEAPAAATAQLKPEQGTQAVQTSQAVQKFLHLLQTEGSNPLVQQLSEDLQKLIAEARPVTDAPPAEVKATEQPKGTATRQERAAETNNVKNEPAAPEQVIAVKQTASRVTASEALSKLQVIAAKQGVMFEQLTRSAETKTDVQPAGANDQPETTGLVFNVHNGVTAKAADNVHAMPKPVSAQSFVQDMSQFVLKTIKVNALNGFSEAKLTLTPEHLGQVDVKISLQNGQLVAQFTAQTQMGREMIESQLSHLRSTLTGQGLHVEKIEVSQSSAFQSGMFHDGRQQTSQQFMQQSNRQPERYEQGNEEFSLDGESSEDVQAPMTVNGFDVTA